MKGVIIYKKIGKKKTNIKLSNWIEKFIRVYKY